MRASLGVVRRKGLLYTTIFIALLTNACVSGAPVSQGAVLLSAEQDDVVWETDIRTKQAVLFFALPDSDADIRLALSCPFRANASLMLQAYPHDGSAKHTVRITGEGASIISLATVRPDAATDGFYAEIPVSLTSKPFEAFLRTGRLQTRGPGLDYDIVVPAARRGEIDKLFNACLHPSG
jgi:hypothetical protein